MAYTTINKSSLHMNTKLYTGTGSSNALAGVGFQPDWTWIKKRDGTNYHVLTDAVRGATKQIYSNDIGAEETVAEGLKSFDSDGFTLGTNGDTNGSGGSYVSWNWKETATSGFDIVQFESDGSGIATVSHNLNAIPKFIITKNIDVSDNWQCYHNSLGNTGFITLNSTNGSATSSTFWNSTTPTSSNFQISKSNLGSGTIICYVFAEKTGYSKIGSFVSNGNDDGSFIYTGFKSSFILLKKSSGSGTDWYIFNNKSPGYNDNNKSLRANTTATEASASGYSMDILSNGFKIRTSNTALGESGATYIYYAVGQSLVGSNNIPCTAR